MNYKNFIEYQNWGLNPLTISFIGTIILTILQCWGMHGQRKTIIEKDSSQSIHLLPIAYYCSYFICATIFGLRTGSIAMIMNIFLAIFFIMTYISAVLAPDSDEWKKSHLFFLVLITIQLFIPDPRSFFVFLLAIACFIGTLVPVKIYFERDSGSVEPKFIWTLIIGVVFWLVYFWYIDQILMAILSGYSLLSLSTAIALWCMYSPKAKARYFEELKEIEKELLKEETSLSQNQIDDLGQIESLATDMGGSEIGLCLSATEYLKKRRMKLLRRIGRLPFTSPTIFLPTT